MFGIELGGTGRTTKPLVALVTIVDSGSDRLFSRTFAESPIRIGSHPRSDLQLRHPQVARCHGEISFQPGRACFVNRAWSKQTYVDRWRLAHGEAVWLAEQSVIALGPFRIDVSLCKPRLRDDERSRKATPLVLPCLSNAARPETGPPPARNRIEAPAADPVLASYLRLARGEGSSDEFDQWEDGAASPACG
jgi:pSer/pThr/pTyr-binding forkhead associated (FHA) protein